ncbi:hypothetical protein [Streptomyces lomondensis]|uniref:Secreted protein n=1 Tax=Streptomyces lomondensis TaxID=68229 RepID=A0ABQ2X0T6_9ACTN|nr:hypothetical protein [Streptomyces lomondensis]MCF0075891.1 hypothetical protein [Streptomyces lomondensis]GGW90239.1 hypothetical protein GCM10010383_19700 [Streptomyces lomondensis]
MTWSAALPGAALRMLRTAAGRRALQVGLLVGGVLLIGLLCGERAHAADGGRVLTNGTAGWTEATDPHVVPGADAAHGVRAVEERVVRAAGVVGQVVSGGRAESGAEATEPAPAQSPKRPSTPVPPDRPKPPRLPAPVLPELRLLSGLPTGPTLPELPDAPAAPALPELPPLSDLPAQPPLPTLPDAPAVPDAPALPDLPSLPALPDVPAPPDDGVALPGEPGSPWLPSRPALPGHALPVPVVAQPQPGGVQAPSDDGSVSVERSEVMEPTGAGAGTRAYDAEHGSRAGRRDHGDPDRAGQPAHVRHAPAEHAPGGRPDGTLGHRATVDNSTSRQGDVHAVTLDHRAPLRLVPGAAACSYADGTRDRHRDVSVFPG